MEKFEINETNKILWDKNFIKVEDGGDVLSCIGDGISKKAEPLNNDPTIQEYGAITDILKHGYLHKNYKIFNTESKEVICSISKEPLKIYDVVLFINGWEECIGFFVFMGATDDDTRCLFKYFHSPSDSIRNFYCNLYKL